MIGPREAGRKGTESKRLPLSVLLILVRIALADLEGVER